LPQLYQRRIRPPQAKQRFSTKDSTRIQVVLELFIHANLNTFSQYDSCVIQSIDLKVKKPQGIHVGRLISNCRDHRLKVFDCMMNIVPVLMYRCTLSQACHPRRRLFDQPIAKRNR